MSLPIRRHPQARTDLIRIWSFIAQDNEPAADRMILRFEQTFAMLANHPLTGRATGRGGGLRSFAVGNYVVFYRALPDSVLVIRVLSGYQDVDALDFPPG